ncbi:MAG: DUF3572 domain-containing protein [Hyphomicrobiales bacterium]|nr:DUF3572 domain-containing protein [Hyphomicrobiales bacterium]
MLKRPSTRANNLAPSREKATELAIAALSFIAQDPDCIGRFMALSGLSPRDLRAATDTPGFFAAVLEFLCSQEPDLIAFAANAGVSPEAVDLARRVLAGPEGEWST